MLFHQSSSIRKSSHRLIRLSLSGILIAGGAIGAIAIHEIAFTNPNLPQANRALAQSNGGWEDVVSQVSPAVVSIETDISSGSGAIISSEGLVLTNAHVVKDVKEVTVILKDKTRLTAKVIAWGGTRKDGKDIDLALLQIQGQPNLPTIRLGSIGSVRVGQEVIAIGSPLSYPDTVTKGIVSRLDSEKGIIQTDAQLNHGNSGGPLLNSQGELIGINTGGRTDADVHGINFAISVDRVQYFLAHRELYPPERAQVRCLGSQSPQQIIPNGAAVNGRLSSNDNILSSDQSFCNLYTFTAKAGHWIAISIASVEFHPSLLLLNPNGRQLTWGSGNANDDRINQEIPQDGTYTIIANSDQPGKSGNYSLLVEDFALRTTGTLNPNESFRDFPFKGKAGQSIRIAVKSNQESTLNLLLAGPNGQLISKGAGELVTKLPDAGLYVVRVSASNPQDQKQEQFEITIREQ